VGVKSKCPTDETLHAFAEGLLDRAEGTDLEEHLKACELCRVRLREIVDLSRALGAYGRDRRAAPDARREGERGAPPEGCPGDELLAAYADGSLEGRSAARVEAHLARCESCLATVADLLALSGAEEHEVRAGSVEKVLARLDDERRTAVVRLAERSVELIRGFAAPGLREGPGTPFAGPAPAFATARGVRAPIRLGWSGAGPLAVDCEIRRVADGAALTGRVTSDATPAPATFVALVTPDGTRGPESPDARGRFGPWKLGPGRNRLVLTGGGDAEGTVELWIELLPGDP
jgi:anti-sigma factor RsiW